VIQLVQRVLLIKGWRLGSFEQDGERSGAYRFDYDDRDWLVVTIPSEVHLELLKQGIIEDIFYHKNIDKYSWIPNREWWYRLRFRVPNESSFSKVFLVFHGLDTLATVWLNERRIGHFRNMFREYRVEITKEILKDDENLLAIKLSPLTRSSKRNSRNRENWSNWIANEWLNFRPEFRKAQMSFGWDIAPRLLTIGVWKEVELLLVRNAVIDDVHITTKITKDSKEAEVTVVVQVTNYNSSKELILISEILDEGNLVSKAKKSLRVIKGIYEVTFNFKIRNPKLWWPWDLGDPHLYDLKVSLLCDGELEDSRMIRFGVRSVKLRTKDPSSKRNTFTFFVNGEPVYVRGINWTPPHAIFVSTSKEDYEKLLTMVKDMNANMLRIWGGGIYPHDVFYELCDKMGIMVWQDFMFACARYPTSEEFLSEVEEEAKSVVRRLRNHPSIVLWCGDNECDTMFHPKGHPVNRIILKRVCQELDGTRPYWPSSPSGGEEPNSPREGDVHIWHHGEYYKSKVYESELEVALFISEIGHLSCPDIETLKSYIPKERLWPPNESYRFGYHPWNFKRLKALERAMKTYWEKVPETLEEYIRVSQLLQAEAYKYWIEKCRRRKFNNSGIVLWNVTDCWPQCSDSIIDYYRRPKLAYYYVKLAFSPVLILAEKSEKEIVLWVINDTLKSISGHWRVLHCEYPNKIMDTHEGKVYVPANSSRIVGRLSAETLRIRDKSREYLLMEISSNEGRTISKNIMFFAETKDISFPPEKLIISLLRQPNR